MALGLRGISVRAILSTIGGRANIGVLCGSRVFGKIPPISVSTGGRG